MREGVQPVEGDGDGAGEAGPEGRAAAIIGVLGAGTMGAGIAQLACRSGAETLLYDPLADALERGRERIADGLRREAAKRLLTAEQAADAQARVTTVAELEAMAPCELVIEAVPERLELKHELLRSLSEIVSRECVLATNTSSLPVTAIAAAAAAPERVVGMHFFNPAPVMRLLEVIAGERSAADALALAHATGEAMGKVVIRASDGPGFLVNRCNRPFGLEALRLLGERIADVETIDRIVRMAGGFRMGPFELMDLVGIDTGFEVSKSFYEQSFGEPRWRPSPITARYAAAGLHGRKSGRGYYSYESGAAQAPAGTAAAAGGPPHRAEDPAPLASAAPARGDGAIVLSGEGALARELRAAAQAAGYEVRSPHDPTGGVLPGLIVECDRERDGRAVAGAGSSRGEHRAQAAPQGGAHVILCAEGSLAALDGSGSAVGFYALPPFAGTSLVELTRGEGSSPLAATRTERFFATLGKHVAWVGDAPGLVLGRIVCQLVNECAFALGEGVGSALDIDAGLVVGMNHPRGPLEWADAMGLDAVLALLDALYEEYGEERYRAAPVLRRLVRAGRLGHASGAGFFEYPDAA